MPKTSSFYICQQCGYQSSSYLGRCPQCQNWGSLVEQLAEIKTKDNKKKVQRVSEVINLKDIEKKDYDRLSTGISEFDRVLGGGIVPGSLVLVSGDPGIGKSTLLSQLAINVNESNISNLSNVLYVAGEESAIQIKMRVDRIKPDANLLVLNEVDVDLIISAIENTKPGLVIIDSIQTLETQDLNSVAGSVGQVRECAHRLQRVAKTFHIPIFLVGHVTKEGVVAGPKALEHLVDAVLSLEGDTTSGFRLLRATKNRFGPTDEVGVFEMEETGMVEITNPSKLFIEQKVNAPGSSIVAVLTGIRPILVEIQALVTKTFLPVPRRVGTGIDNNRLQILIAVLQKRLKLNLYDKDIYVNVTEGMKIFEPAADLAICLSIVSSLNDQSLKPKTVLIGEVGLLGELRAIRQLDKRISEAKKLGFTNIVTSNEAKTLEQAFKKAF